MDAILENKCHRKSLLLIYNTSSNVMINEMLTFWFLCHNEMYTSQTASTRSHWMPEDENINIKKIVNPISLIIGIGHFFLQILLLPLHFIYHSIGIVVLIVNYSDEC